LLWNLAFFDIRLSRGNTVQEEAKAKASGSAKVDASLEINHSTKSSVKTKGDKKMKEQTETRTDHLTVRAKGTLVVSIIVGLVLMLTTGLTASTPSHG
jgi:hypothetical protein